MDFVMLRQDESLADVLFIQNLIINKCADTGS